MHISRRLIAIPLLLAAACSEQSAAVVSHELATAVLDEETSIHAGASAAHLEIQCGGYRVMLVGNGENAVVERIRESSKQTLRKPEGMTDFVPVGMGCTQSSSGEEYLVVEYGEPLIGCNVCEWFFVYDRDGQPLNQSVPKMLGEGESLYPNNRGYSEVVNRLGLQRHDIQYAPRRHALDVEMLTEQTKIENANQDVSRD